MLIDHDFVEEHRHKSFVYHIPSKITPFTEPFLRFFCYVLLFNLTLPCVYHVCAIEKSVPWEPFLGSFPFHVLSTALLSLSGFLLFSCNIAHIVQWLCNVKSIEEQQEQHQLWQLHHLVRCPLRGAPPLSSNLIHFRLKFSFADNHQTIITIHNHQIIIAILRNLLLVPIKPIP